MKPPRYGRLALAGATVVLAIGTFAAPAFAHVEPSPDSVAAASTDTISFNVEHGCADSPTIKLEMKLPDGVTDAKPGPLDGWTSTVAGGVVTWTGGPQPHDQELHVPLEMTFPNTPGATLLFPLVQTCEQGETRWVDPPNPDGSEPEDPAPVVTLTAAVPGEGTTAAVPESTAPVTTNASATTAASVTSGAGTTTAVVATTAASSDDSSDNTAAIVAVVAIAIVAIVGVGGFLFVRSRQS